MGDHRGDGVLEAAGRGAGAPPSRPPASLRNRRAPTASASRRSPSGRPGSEPTTSPFASTASTPTTCGRIVPYRSTREPPAFVAIAPPIVATSRAAKSTGVSSPAALGVRPPPASVTPAPAVTCIDAGSTGPRWSSRVSDSTIDRPIVGRRHRRRSPAVRTAARFRRPARCCPAWGTTMTPGSLQHAEDRGDLLGRPWADDGRATSAVTARPVGLETRPLVGIDEHVRRADDRSEFVDDRHHPSLPGASMPGRQVGQEAASRPSRTVPG